MTEWIKAITPLVAVAIMIGVFINTFAKFKTGA